MGLGGRKHESPDNGTCPHNNVKGVVVSAVFKDGQMDVVSVVGCNDCNASWTASTYDAVKTH